MTRMYLIIVWSHAETCHCTGVDSVEYLPWQSVFRDIGHKLELISAVLCMKYLHDLLKTTNEY